MIRITAALMMGMMMLPHIAFGQNKDQQEPSVRIMSATPLVSVQVNVSTGDEPMVIPYCSKGDTDVPSLCGGWFALEIRTKQGWVPVKLRYKEIVLGAYILSKAGAVKIQPKHGRDFSFSFSTEVFAVQRGDKLRVVFDT